MRITAGEQAVLDELLQQLTTFGCHPVRERDALVKPAEKDRCVPDDFYSTTNHRTHVRIGGKWVEVDKQRMDAVIVAADGRAECRKLRDVKAGEPVVCGHEGIRVTPEFRERDRLGFAFMSNDVSSERRVEGSVARIAEMMREVKKAGGRIAVVAGPVVVHTGGVEHFSALIRRWLRRRRARRQRAGGARHRVRAVGHLARHRSRGRRAGRAGPPQSHGGDQHDQPRRQHPPGGRDAAS